LEVDGAPVCAATNEKSNRCYSYKLESVIMEIRQLEYFVAVAEEANFTRAAERVHISQSGVSAQIRRLEDDLGAALIDRSSRTASLTSAGVAALDGARAVLAAVDAVRQAVDEVNGLVRGALVIGMVTGCTVTPLFDALASFHLAHPRVDISLLEDNSERLLERVRSGTVDMALVGTPSATLPGLESFPIVSERLVAIVPCDHPLAEGRRTTLPEITAHPIVCLPQGTGVRAVFDEACAIAGINPSVALQASAPGTVVDLARRGLGIAVLSESMVPRHDERLRALLIDDAAAPAVLALVWSPEPSPALRELARSCRQAFAGPPGATPSRP
jgi:DNA-binding transcriptional LysR family regulator